MQSSATINRLSEHASKDIYANSNLTKLQMIYWVGQSLRPNSPLFNVIVTFRLRTLLDVNVFSEAFASVVRSSDSLRTLIVDEDGVPKRVIVAEPPEPLEVLDFSSELDPEATLQAWLNDRSQQALNIAECAYDVVLVRLGEDNYFWYVNQHHMIVDAASVFIVFRRVKEAYLEALEKGEITQPADIPAFEAYVAFEKEYRNSPRYEKSAIFWQKRLVHGVEPLKFFGRSPQKRGHKQERVPFELDIDRSQQLKKAMERPGVFNMTHDLGMLNVLLTLYFAHLHYMTGNKRLATMMPFHNRPTKAMKRTIGLLMEVCPMLVEIEEGETFATLSKKVSKSLQQTLLHYQYGTAVAMQNNLLDLMFNFHHRPEITFNDNPVAQELVHPQAGSDSFALHIHEFESDGAFTFFFDFHEDVFKSAERAVSIAAFETILDAYLADFDTPLADLDLPTAVSQVQIPNGTNKTVSVLDTKPNVAGPRNELEQQLLTVWQKVLGLETISIHDDFFDLGGSSWVAVRLFTELQAETGHNLPLATLFQAPTIATLAEHMHQGNEEATWSSLVPIRKKGSKPPYFCIHGVTGDILWLRELAEMMDADQPFYGIQARGLDGDAEPFDRLEEMAAYYLQQIRRIQPNGPYYLGGYCMGGDIAYEVARQIQAAGEEVPVLTIIDPPPADLRERAPLNGRFVIDFMHNSPHWLREFMRLGGSEISARVRRKGRVVARSLWQKIRNSSEGKEVSATDVIDQADDLPEHRQRLIEAHLDALLKYTHPGYDGEVIVYEAKSRPLLNPGNHAYEWVDYVSRPITIRTIAGSHSSILHKPHVTKLAQDLQCSLDQARAQQKADPV